MLITSILNITEILRFRQINYYYFGNNVTIIKSCTSSLQALEKNY